MIQREFSLYTEQFVAEITYELGTTKFGYGDTDDAAVTDALVDCFGAIQQILIFRKTDKTKTRRICGSTVTLSIYNEFIAN